MQNVKYIIILLVFALSMRAQNTQQATLKGKLTDKEGKPIDFANIFVKNTKKGTSTNKYGEFSLKIPANKNLTIIISHLEYLSDTLTVNLKPGQVKTINKKLSTNYNIISDVVVEDKEKRIRGITRLDSKKYEIIPTTTGGIESLIKTLPGVSSNNELSSQYNVRGGNFDENLIYVNDVEVFRPQLIKSGEQEGLSFVNSDLVKSVEFSAGGFEARYGDKMSSVLDIKYKTPNKFAGSVSGGLLGGSAHLEGSSENHKLKYLVGARYKANSYLLNSLDTKGDYKPRFWDIQSFISYEINEKWELSYLGNYSDNTYNFIPQDRETSFGTVNNALGLKIYFDGQEADRFQTLTNAVTLNFTPDFNTKLSLTASSFVSKESENYDILGQYYLNELDKNLGSDNLGDSLMNIGVGSFLTHARNRLYSEVYTLSHKGQKKIDNQTIYWGISLKNENFDDQLNEWELRDSAGYSLPFPDTAGYKPEFVSLYSSLNAKHQLQNKKFSFYAEDSYNFGQTGRTNYNLNAGVRFLYSEINNEFLASPRLSFSIIPNWEKDIVFRFATGLYYQPPFYREFRNLEGNLNLNVKSQQSIHFVLGSDYNFKIWNRPFKLITEVYYKILNNLNPYIIDNVRVRYLANNNAHGYATGIDMKLNGEFVPGTDSWISLSFMKTEEDIDGDGHGYIPRPADQLFNLGLFYQDFVPKFPTWKVHLNLVYGSGLPFGPPNSERYQQTLRMPAYKRLDIGFTKILINENTKLPEHSVFSKLKAVWITAEAFNLLNIKNVISYYWVKDIRNRQYAVPNYLTGLRINVKLTVKF